MTRVTLTYSYDVDDEEAFLAAADRAAQEAWGSSLADLVGDDATREQLLVQAMAELHFNSDGRQWPDGVSDDANVNYSGHTEAI